MGGETRPSGAEVRSKGPIAQSGNVFAAGASLIIMGFGGGRERRKGWLGEGLLWRGDLGG